MDKFTHLHLHTEYSLLDGVARINDILEKCVHLGMDSVAITDHGNMYGVVDFYKAAITRNIKPIIGCEVYVAARKLTDQESRDRESAHLILLAKNNLGYKNLIKLVSIGHVDGFYYRPRVDYETIAKYSDGLICTSACLAGDLARYIESGQYDSAKDFALKLKGIFGDGNFYIELQDQKLPIQKQVNAQLVKLAEEIQVPLVATNDVHYIDKEDADAHDVLLCIQTNRKVSDENRMKFGSDDFYLKSPEEMSKVFGWCREAIDNTQIIADACNVTFDFDTVHLPEFETGEKTPLQLFKELCNEGLKERYTNPDQSIIDRMNYEIDVIDGMGYTNYYLIVWDFVRYARDNEIEVGPGRGSGAGSLTAYLMNITDVDPIKYNLLFERFLNPERVSMPDFDIDFCYERRQEVIDYVIHKYGDDHVAQIITFGTMAARAAIRDVGRALDLGYSEVDQIAKMIPRELKITLASAMEKSRELREACEERPGIKRLVDMASKLEGLPRHASTHAAGVLVSKEPVVEYVPLNRNGDIITTQFPMTTIEELGLLKIDFLGLRTLTVIRDAVDLINSNPMYNVKHLNIRDIPYDDKKVFNLISAGDTEGMFQLESAGMKAFLKEMKPDKFDEIIDAISLYRPGPMEIIPKYIMGKRDASTVVYDAPIMEQSLDVTYGCMVYQEQVMQVVRDMAGYSLGRSDIVRRAMSKKKKDVMEKERDIFINGLVEDGQVVVKGCVNNGISIKVANKVYDDMMDFANYAFSKNHAAPYAVIAYRTAWLKAHYPVELMAALMNSVMGRPEKIASYIQYCRAHGIEILTPDVNKSGVKFTVEEGNIRFGLAAIRNVGKLAIRGIMKIRQKNGDFTDFFDFCNRVEGDHLNKRMLESLIKAGAFDSFNVKRTQLIAVYEGTLDGIQKANHRNIVGQMNLFAEATEDFVSQPRLPDIPEYIPRMKLSLEKEMTGVYITGHPLNEYAEALKDFSINSLSFVQNSDDDDELLKDGQVVQVAGIVVEKSLKNTRSNEIMAFVTIEDLYGTIEFIAFPKIYDTAKNLLENDTTIMVSGTISIRENESPKILANYIGPLSAKTTTQKLFLRYTSKLSEFEKEVVMAIIHKYPGKTPVTLYLEETKKQYKLPENECVLLNDDLLSNLIDVLGNANVKTVIHK